MTLQLPVVFFDTEESYLNLLPLAFTRPLALFRVGIDTISEKWVAMLGNPSFSFLPQEYLREKYPPTVSETEEVLLIAGNILPDEHLVEKVLALREGEALKSDGSIWAYRGSIGTFLEKSVEEATEVETGCRKLRYVFDIFLMNSEIIREDFERIVAGRTGEDVDATNIVIGPRTDGKGRPQLFIEEGATVRGAILNLSEGPVYIGKDAVVMEGSMLRGPLAICEQAKIKMGAKIYEGSTFGPYCKVGGELSNVVMFGYSNKAHDGYLGNAVIGEWCNIGAGTNASNLKNDYSKIRIWNYARHTFMRTDLQFCGLIMGDHSKAGINCMFNTATVVGVGVNLHGAGFPRPFIPSFLQGCPEAGMNDTPISSFMAMAGRVMGRRDLMLTDADMRIFEQIYEHASRYK